MLPGENKRPAPEGKFRVIQNFASMEALGYSFRATRNHEMAVAQRDRL
jgi:hypothetical protein